MTNSHSDQSRSDRKAGSANPEFSDNLLARKKAARMRPPTKRRRDKARVESLTDPG